jgi:hypothetical protein
LDARGAGERARERCNRSGERHRAPWPFADSSGGRGEGRRLNARGGEEASAWPCERPQTRSKDGFGFALQPAGRVRRVCAF